MTAIFLGANAPQTLVKNYAIADFALSYYANADFATCLHYVYEFVFVYVFDYVFEYVYVFVFEYDYSSNI